MVHLRGAFDPERGTALAARLDARVEALFHSGDTVAPVEVMPGVESNDQRRALAPSSSARHGVLSSLDSIAPPRVVTSTSILGALQLSHAEPPVPLDDTRLTDSAGSERRRLQTAHHSSAARHLGPDAVDGPNAARSDNQRDGGCGSPHLCVPQLHREVRSLRTTPHHTRPLDSGCLDRLLE